MSDLSDLKDIDSVSRLSGFLNGLGYKSKADLLYIPDFGFPDSVKRTLKEFYLLSDYEKKYQIYLAKIPALTRSNYRNIIESFNRKFPQVNSLFIFTKDWSEIAFVNPERIPVGVGKTKLKLKTLTIDRTYIYHTDLEVMDNIRLTQLEQSPDIIYEKQKNAFDVEQVTQKFFDAYKGALATLKDILSAQKKAGSAQEVHTCAQQLLSRIMFLYFVQKKGWLKWKDYVQDKKYLKNLWDKYKAFSGKKTNFYSQWLSKLFFHAFQGPGRHAIIHKDPHLPGEIKESFVIMPFLNGGLFIENRLDKIGFEIPDEYFKLLFDLDPFDSKKGFLERFNFTIHEDTPLEVEVAVDPEMLGKVYESLISEEERGKSGIFYTPRIEIDFMCRLSLVEYLTEETGLPKTVLIPLVFEPQTILEDTRFKPDDLQKVIPALHKARIVDPAVGSASFLVGMMNVLVEIYKNLFLQVEKKEKNLFELKQQVILENLYGVDVKDWAVMVGELRLWLSLIIETDEKYMNIYNKPLLPSFTFKLRQGDSLVEEIAGKQLSLRGEFRYVPGLIKKRIEEIKSRKAEYFTSARHEWVQEIEALEHRLLRDILKEEIKRLSERIRAREAYRAMPKKTMHMFKTKAEIAESRSKRDRELETEIERLKREKERLEETLAGIGKKKDYFFWEIDFAEVFAEKGGFDIVIGNPPYVRQEQIAFPLEREEDYGVDEWRERKKEYKDKLISSAKLLWGDTIKIDKKSDLYVYFYYHGLSLLKPKGSFCFINSNSWLDVGYGTGLQEFLLKRLEPFYVIDNIAKRSFESDVNTVIVLIKRPSNGPREGPLKFIAFKKPFEAVIKAETILEIENIHERTANDNFRISPKDRKELLIEGLEMPDEEKKRLIKKEPMHMPYSGNKWGGKYLRAPDVVIKVIEKSFTKKLNDFAQIKYGLKTGAEKFFYIPQPEVGLNIEKNFLIPLLQSPKESRSIRINKEELENMIIYTNEPKNKLKDTKLYQRIKWGEREGIHLRPSVKGNKPWYSLKHRISYLIVCPRLVNDRHIFFWNPDRFLIDDSFSEIEPLGKISSEFFCLYLNSSFNLLLVELFGTIGLGQGALFVSTDNLQSLPCLDFNSISMKQIDKALLVFDKFSLREIRSIFQEIGINPDYPIREQNPNPLPDRKALDDIVFDILGLTDAERNEVYWAVCELVKNRLEKAKSV